MHFSFAWNAVCHNGNIPYTERFGKGRKAPKTPFGAMVWRLPTLRNNANACANNFGAVALEGISGASHHKGE